MTLNRREFLKKTALGTTLAAAGAPMVGNRAFAMTPPLFQDKSGISFVGSAATGTRRAMIAGVLEPWRAAVAAGIGGKTILIKVNMVYWNTAIADPGLSLTHVDAVRGLLDFLRTINAAAPVVIGDCTANSGANGDILRMFARLGYDLLTKEYTGVSLADLNTLPSTDRPFWTTSFSASSTVAIPVIGAFTDSKYYVISICRPKTHNNVVMTGVNKNILMGAPLHSGTADGVGVVPKQFMHGQNGWFDGMHADENKCLSYNMFQMANVIYATGTPALSILDAWEGMEGDGPTGGTSVMQYCAVSGIDPLAVDRISAKLMGFSDTATEPMNKATPSYTDMRVLVWISNAGFGNYDLSKINFIHGSITDVEKYVKQYKMSSLYTGEPSYETNWTGGPPEVIPMPYLVPQVRRAITGDVIINFTLPVNARVRLGIFNLQGAEVNRLGDEFLPAGRYTMVWDGCNARGARVGAGMYVIKLNFGSRAICDQVTMVR